MGALVSFELFLRFSGFWFVGRMVQSSEAWSGVAHGTIWVDSHMSRRESAAFLMEGGFPVEMEW